MTLSNVEATVATNILSGPDRKREEVLRPCQGSLEHTTRCHNPRKSMGAPVAAWEKVRICWANVLGLDAHKIRPDDSFVSLGGNLISAMRCVEQCAAVGIQITVGDIFQCQTIARLVEHSSPHESGPQQIANGFVEVSPMQKLLLRTNPVHFDHCSQTVVLRLKRTVTEGEALDAITALVQRHEMLRARFTRSSNGQWAQHVTSQVESSFRFEHHQVASKDEIHKINRQSGGLLNIRDGPISSLTLIDVEQRGLQYVSLVIHQLVADEASWVIVLSDLENCLESSTSTRDSSKPFLTWCSEQAQYARTSLPSSKALPQDYPSGVETIDMWGPVEDANTIGDSDLYSFTLNEHMTTSLLGKANEIFDTKPSEIIQGAMFYSFIQTFGDRSAPIIYAEEHGREPWTERIDLESTVGCFTTVSPTYMPRVPGESLADVIMRTKITRRALPAHGWAYFTSRMLTDEGREAFDSRHPFEILFRYTDIMKQASRIDSPFAIDHIPVPCVANNQLQRSSLVDICAVAGERGLDVHVQVNRLANNQGKLREWIERCEKTLQEAVVELNMLQLKHQLSGYPVQEQPLRLLLEKSLHKSGSIEDIYPCTPAQHGILISQIRDPQQYYNRYTVEVHPAEGQPAVDTWQLSEAWKKVVARHAALRTIFVSLSSQEVLDQVVLRDYVPELPAILNAEWTDVEKARTEARMNNSDALEPTTKAAIYRRPDGQVLLDIFISHMLVDATSLQVLMRDLTVAYSGTLDLDDRPLYKLFVENLGDQSDKDQYWKQYLQGVETCRILDNKSFSVDPAGHRKPEMQYVQMHQFLETPALKTFCSSHGILLTNLLHFAWGLVLRCYTAMDRVCFGYTTSGRERDIPGIHDAVGLFVNVLIRRLSFSDEQPILECLQTTQKSFLESLAHQDCSFANIQHSAKLVGQSIFDSSVSIHYENTVQDGPLNAAVVLRRLDTDGLTEYPLVLNISIGPERVELMLSYWDTAVSHEYATTIAETYQQVLTEILHGKTTVGEIKVLSSESQMQIAEWNKAPPREVPECVHNLIHRRILETPYATAVRAWDGNLTYQQLNTLSSKLANVLVYHGIGPEVFVPICFEKSKWVPVAVLSVLKAGGAFLLLDPSLPQLRLEEMCLCLGVKLIITSDTKASLARSLVPDCVVLNDTYPNLGLEYSNGNLAMPHVAPHNAAFVLFTSGSTGKPKAVVAEHKASCSQLADLGRVFHLTPESRVLQFSSYAFDVSCIDILSTLVNGACLCIPSEADRLNRLSEIAATFEATYICTTPSVARLLDRDAIPSLQRVVLGGEPVCQNDITTWGERLIIGYGPAEGGFTTVRFPVSPDESVTNIGKAIPGARTWIVNERNHNQLLPIGAAGELLIEGPILFRGYHNDTEAANRSVIDSPIWKSWFNIPSGARFYKTGDIVRYTQEGSLVFLGRRDDQVKLRGQRIELQEVRHHVKEVFAQTQDVVADIITASGDEGKQQILVSFVLQLGANKHRSCPENGSQMLFLPPTESFRSDTRAAVTKLRKRLPPFMVPALFLPLAYMPMTSSGKVDRKTIRKQAQSLRGTDVEPYSVAQINKRRPSGLVEATLHTLISDLLNQTPDSIGVNDDLSQRGLDSLIMIKYVGLLRKQGLQLSIADVFNHPRISDLAPLASHVDQENQKPADNAQRTNNVQLHDMETIAELRKHLSRLNASFDLDAVIETLPTTGFQREYLQCSHQAYFAFQLSALPDTVRLQAALRAVLEKHSVLRTVFVPVAGTFLQVVQEPFDFSLIEILSDGEDFESAVQELCRKDAAVPVPYGAQSFQSTLVKRPNGCSTLILRLSHAQYDGWSIPLLISDISRSYEGEELATKPTFSDFIVSRARLLREPSVYEAWSEILRGSSMTSLPSNILCHAAHTNRQIMIERDCTVSLHSLPSGFTVATLHKAAWALVLSRRAKINDVVFGQVVSGRNLPTDGIEDVMGPCVNIIPVRIKLDTTWTVRKLLDYVLKQHVRTLELETVDLEDIVERSISWPKGTCFGSVVQHQNTTGTEGASLDLGSLSGTLSIHAFNYMPAYPVIYTEPVGDDQLILRVMSSSRIMDAETVDDLLGDFSRTMARMASALDQAISAI